MTCCNLVPIPGRKEDAVMADKQKQRENPQKDQDARRKQQQQEGGQGQMGGERRQQDRKPGQQR